MELANIEELVEKYLNAATTLQEEKTLSNYFLSENVASHLQEYQYMFGYFNKNKEEAYTKDIALEQKKSPKKGFKWLQVAVSVVLLVSVYFGYQKYQTQQYQRAQLQQVKETLELVSLNLNRSNEAVEHLYTYENTVTKILNQVN